MTLLERVLVFAAVGYALDLLFVCADSARQEMNDGPARDTLIRWLLTFAVVFPLGIWWVITGG